MVKTIGHAVVQAIALTIVLTIVPTAVLTGVQPAARASNDMIVVTIETSIGSIDVEIDSTHAPITAANFLRYVDHKMYDGGRFHRAVRLDNQARKDVLIQVIQGGRGPEQATSVKGFGPIALERTSVTTLKHVDGAISMARGNTADSASSDFFLCIGDNPSLDFGGQRAADAQGFAAFGRVTSGMAIVRNIQAGATNDREQLLEPIAIIRVRRK
jgi:peptidyl-prolyl cis-trans isomerase A (cyclophilin A)